MSYRSSSGRDRQLENCYILKPGSGLKLKRPVWGHPTRFRIFPRPLNESKAAPIRMSSDAYDFTDWIYAARVASFVGVSRRISFIDEIPGDDQGFQQTPMQILVNTMRAKPSGYGVRWEAYPDMKDRQAPIRRSKMFAFVQGSLLMEYIKDQEYNYLAQKRPQIDIVMMLPKSAMHSLEDLMELQVDKYQGDPTDWGSRYVYGNLLDPEKGRAIVIRRFNPAAVETTNGGPSELTMDMTQGFGAVRPAMSSIPTFARYEVVPDMPLKVPAALVHKHWKNWDDVMYKLQPDQQVELLCTAFPPNLMRAAFSATDWLPERIRSGKVYSIPTHPKPNVSSAAAIRPQPAAAGDETSAALELDESMFQSATDVMDGEDDDMPGPDDVDVEAGYRATVPGGTIPAKGAVSSVELSTEASAMLAEMEALKRKRQSS